MKKLVSKIIYGGGVFFDLSKWVALVLIIMVLINAFWISIFVVDGASMEPTLHDGEVVLMDKSFFRGDQKPQRGDEVVVAYPGDPEHKRYVKRVIGLPGEKFQILSNKIYINGKLLHEAYIPIGVITQPDGMWALAADQYFLMGDNRENSNDSRFFGPVEKRFFIGKALNVIFPHLRSIESPKY